MKILLKDPTLVDAVIKKITDKYPCSCESFIKYCVPAIKKELHKESIFLNVEFGFDLQSQRITSKMYYDKISEIATDEGFINDKEW